MKITFTKVIFILISFIILSSCQSQKDFTKIYSFSGENEFIEINNGLIIITKHEQKFVGGDLKVKDPKHLNVTSKFTKYLFNKDGTQVELVSNASINYASITGDKINCDLGTITSKTVFHKDDLSSILKSLNFSINGNLISGSSYEYNLVLDIEEIY